MKLLFQSRSNKPVMKFVSGIVSAVALMLLASAPAAVAQIYNFTFTGNGGMDATGTITISSTVAQSGSINVVNVPLEANPSMTTSAAGNLLTAGGDVRDLDGDVITYDTVAYPPPSDPVFDGTGVAFASGPAGSDGGTPIYDTLINIWGNGPGSYTMFVGEANPADLEPDGTLIPGRDAQWVYVSENGTMTFTPVPEPATDALLLGALMVGFVAMRRRAAA
jgi:hypothetical protein